MALILGKISKNLRVMNKLLITFLLLILFSFILASCGKYTSKYSYRWGEDGLIYNVGNNQLYTGTVLDTSDVIISFEVVNGKKNGLFTTYYPGGQVEKTGYVINNNNVGEWKYFYPNGQIESIGSFENNKAEGRWISYYANGNKKCEGNYRRGKEDGLWIYYNEKGKTINMILYEDGEFVDLQQKFT